MYNATDIAARFNGDTVKAIEWLKIERAQNAYIATNARHATTVAEADAAIVQINAAIAELNNPFFGAELLPKSKA